MKKKIAALLCVTALLISCFSACSKLSGGNSAEDTTGSNSETVPAETAKSTDASADTKTKEPVTLEILLSDDTLEGGAMATLVAKFNEEYKDKGIKAEINEVAYDDIDTQIINRAAANEPPALVKTSGFEDYLDYILPLDDTSVNQINFLRSGVRKGVFYATPINSTSEGLIVNKTAFDKAGVSYPKTEADRWTWDEFEEALKKVMANSDVKYGIVIDHSQERLQTVLYQFGMKYFDTTNQTVTFKSDGTKKGIQFILDLYKGGLSPASVGNGTENAQSTFKTGTVAAHFTGNWVLTDYYTNIKDFEWDVALMPKDQCCATCLGGNWLYAFKGSGVEDEAVEFMNWLYQPENYKLYCSTGNYLPAVGGIDPTYSVNGLDIFKMEIDATVPASVEDSEVISAHAGQSWDGALRDAFDMGVAGDLDADGIMDYVEEQILGVYDDYKND